MKIRIPVVFVLLLAAAGLAMAAKTKQSAAKAEVERGRYLTVVTGCNDCHSPKLHPGTMQPDPARLLSGRPATTPPPDKPAKMGEIAASGDLTAWWGPWGVSYAANLTPDPTGLGNRYSESSFIKTMRTGKKPDGTDLMPPMPWPDFAQMSDSDLKAIWAYLHTLPPVKNNVKAGS
jgi:cytochrome c553